MAKTGLRLTDKDDISLISMALENGSEAAYLALYTRYHHAVYSHVSKYVSEKEEIEDICIESFEKAFKQLSTFNMENRFSTWLFRIARNTAFDHKGKAQSLGKKVEKTSIDSNPEGMDVPADMPSPEEHIISSQDHDNFLKSIDNLPAHYSEIARMCFVDNLGYKEIAEKAGIPVNTVKTRISRAKSLIVQLMLEMEE